MTRRRAAQARKQESGTRTSRPAGTTAIPADDHLAPIHRAGGVRRGRGPGRGRLLQEQFGRLGRQHDRRLRCGAGGQRHSARRHAYLGRVTRLRAHLDLPGDARRQLHSDHDRQLPVRDVAAAVLVRQRSQADAGAVHEPGLRAGLLQRRQDRDGPAEDQLPVVGRPAGDRQGRAVLHRHGAGRRAGERVELGPLHPAHRAARPGGQRQHPERDDLGAAPEQAGQPAWFTADGLYYIQPIPVHAWAKASPNGPILDFTNPANAKKIYDFLAKASGSTGTYATNPLWQVVDGPYRLTAFNNTTGAYTMAPNPSYGGPQSAKVPTLSAVPYTSDTAEFNAVLSKSIDVGYMPLTDVPQLSRGQGGRVPRLRLPRLGIRLCELQFRRQDRRLQQHHQPALRPAGPRAPGERGGLHQGLLPRRRRPRVRADPLGAHVAVHPRERAE